MSSTATATHPEQKKKLSFPSAYTVLLIVAALVALLTWMVTPGIYDKLSYDDASNAFTVTYASGDMKEFPATQETLDQFDIKAQLDKFTGGDIRKPIGIPGTYTTVEPNPQGMTAFFQAPIAGMYDSIGVVLLCTGDWWLHRCRQPYGRF